MILCIYYSFFTLQWQFTIKNWCLSSFFKIFYLLVIACNSLSLQRLWHICFLFCTNTLVLLLFHWNRYVVSNSTSFLKHTMHSNWSIFYFRWLFSLFKMPICIPLLPLTCPINSWIPKFVFSIDISWFKTKKDINFNMC